MCFSSTQLSCNAKVVASAMEDNKKKTDAHGSVDSAALQNEIAKLREENKKLKAGLEKTKLDERECKNLEKQNAYLKEVIERQRKQLHFQDQMLTLSSVIVAEQERRIQALEDASYDGSQLWRISEYNRRRQEAVSGKTTSFYCPVFYTSRHGYKMSARVYLNGDGMGKHTHMSLFFVVMRGCHDALLPWPFQQKVTFKLLDQNKRDHIVDAFRPDPTSNSFKKPSSDMNIASGCPLFVTQELLMASNSYVKDDTMFIKVVVDTTGLEKL